MVGSERGGAVLRTTALFGLCALLPYVAYLLVVFWLSLRWSLVATLTAATLAWVVNAIALLLAWNRWAS